MQILTKLLTDFWIFVKFFLHICRKEVHLSKLQVFGYVAFLQKNYGLTTEQLNKLAHLPDEYLLECLINGRQPDLNWIGKCWPSWIDLLSKLISRTVAKSAAFCIFSFRLNACGGEVFSKWLFARLTQTVEIKVVCAFWPWALTIALSFSNQTFIGSEGKMSYNIQFKNCNKVLKFATRKTRSINLMLLCDPWYIQENVIPGGRPYVPPDIYYFKWIEHPRTLSYVSERVLASMESLDLNTSKCSTARTLTPREYYQRILLQYCKQMQPGQTTSAGVGNTEVWFCGDRMLINYNRTNDLRVFHISEPCQRFFYSLKF